MSAYLGKKHFFDIFNNTSCQVYKGRTYCQGLIFDLFFILREGRGRGCAVSISDHYQQPLHTFNSNLIYGCFL